MTAVPAVVLLVDDEPHVLDGLRRALRRHAPGWEVLGAASGGDALAVLAERDVDAVVSDMRMPGMDGAALLAEVRRRHPGVRRLVLSGQASQGAVIAVTESAQQFLAKPCDVETLVGAVERGLALRDLLGDQALRDLLGSVMSLPKPSHLYTEVTAAMDREDCRIQDVAALIEGSVGVSTELLRLVNSAFFGLPRHVDTVTSAIALLGFDTLRALLLASSLFRPGPALPAPLDMATLQANSVRRSTLARRLGLAERLPASEINRAALAALVRDVGLLALAPVFPERLPALAGLPHAERAEAERAAFGCSVAQATAYLLALWGFDDALVHVVAGQPVPAGTPGATPVDLIVGAAALAVDEPSRPITGVPQCFLSPDRADRWTQLVREHAERR